MERQLRTLTTMLMIVLVLGLLCIALAPKHLDEIAQIHMLNVGQGDSFLLVAKNGKQILIDGGKDSRVLSELTRVMPKGDKSIDVVIATHSDADHIGGLPLVLARYSVGLFMMPDVASDTSSYLALLAAVEKENIPAYYARSGMMVQMDTDPTLPSRLRILFPDRPTTYWQTNSASIVARLEMGESSVLFTGDSPSSVEHFLAQTDSQALDVDILKLGHHGSKTSSSEEFLKATHPDLALISAGVANSYGHPAKETVARLKELGIAFVSTQSSGTVTLVTDGKTWVQK